MIEMDLEATHPTPPSHKTRIELLAKKRQQEITFAGVIRIDHVYATVLPRDPEKLSSPSFSGNGPRKWAETELRHLIMREFASPSKTIRLQCGFLLAILAAASRGFPLVAPLTHHEAFFRP